MHCLEGRKVRLRAVEPGDAERMYRWENDRTIWSVSGTMAPFSRESIERFIQEQQFDIFQTRQQRLIIETLDQGIAIGAVDLFEFDPIDHRAGVGILIYETEQRGKGYARDAIQTLCDYCREVLQMHQLWCTTTSDNAPSLALFKGAGFEQTGIRRDWRLVGSEYMDEILLQKILK